MQNYFSLKNKIKPSLIKSQLLVEPSCRSGFLTTEAKVAFAKLRQIFIDVPIFHYFDPKYHIELKLIF